MQDTESKNVLSIEELKKREQKFREIAINQLSINNNLLLTLGVGFLAFTFERSAD